MRKVFQLTTSVANIGRTLFLHLREYLDVVADGPGWESHSN